jgi:phenylalanine-4-hydroxylase
LQVTGTFSEVIIKKEEPVYIRTTGPTSLNFNDSQLDGHGKAYHGEGFGSPVGKLMYSDIPLELMSDGDLEALGIQIASDAILEFQSGVSVKGRLEKVIREKDKMILMTFSNCKVIFRDRVLFEPSWGVYDMAVGEKIVSAFSGPADPDAFEHEFTAPVEKTHKIVHSEQATNLHKLYQELRDFRENGGEEEKIKEIWQHTRDKYPEEWLLPLEIFELVCKKDGDPEIKLEIEKHLEDLKNKSADTKRLIDNGMMLLNC